jgi:hypothetical protein
MKYMSIKYMPIMTIVLLNFFIGFGSDLILNYVSRQPYAPAAVKALELYFDRKTNMSAPLRHFESAVNAGLTIVSALIITMLLSQLILGFLHPSTINELGWFIVIAFCVGYVADILIHKLRIFGNTLNKYYSLAGAGLWGAVAFIFSILISYGILFFAF